MALETEIELVVVIVLRQQGVLGGKVYGGH